MQATATAARTIGIHISDRRSFLIPSIKDLYAPGVFWKSVKMSTTEFKKFLHFRQAGVWQTPMTNHDAYCYATGQYTVLHNRLVVFPYHLRCNESFITPVQLPDLIRLAIDCVGLRCTKINRTWTGTIVIKVNVFISLIWWGQVGACCSLAVNRQDLACF